GRTTLTRGSTGMPLGLRRCAAARDRLPKQSQDSRRIARVAGDRAFAVNSIPDEHLIHERALQAGVLRASDPIEVLGENEVRRERTDLVERRPASHDGAVNGRYIAAIAQVLLA